MAKKSKKGYLGLSFIPSLILAIFPVTNIILGIVARVQKGNLFLAILNIILAPVFYIVDLVSIILHNKLTYLI